MLNVKGDGLVQLPPNGFVTLGSNALNFTVELFNPFTPRVKSWVIQSFLTYDSMNRTLKCNHSLENC